MRLAPLAALLLASLAQADAGRALDHLATLDPAGKALPLNATEKRLFSDARDGQFRLWKLEDAALVASGVHDARKRKEYLATFDDLAATARRAVAEAATPRDKADALLRFLHEGPLKAYVRHQTRFDKLLDDGTFNCVSSAVLYNALGSRLGLDLRGVVVPGHAFSAWGEVDVETTTAEGFDPVRKRTRVFLVRRDGITDLGPIDLRSFRRREVRDAGLAALIYSNRAAAAARDKNHLAGALLGLRAMCLDRDMPGATINTRANLIKWSAECLDQGRYERGLTAVAVGLDLEPKSAAFESARRALYVAWGKALVERKDYDAALRVYRDALAVFPRDAAFKAAMDKVRAMRRA